jgi:hypothetical protein
MLCSDWCRKSWFNIELQILFGNSSKKIYLESLSEGILIGRNPKWSERIFPEVFTSEVILYRKGILIGRNPNRKEPWQKESLSKSYRKESLSSRNSYQNPYWNPTGRNLYRNPRYISECLLSGSFQAGSYISGSRHSCSIRHCPYILVLCTLYYYCREL